MRGSLLGVVVVALVASPAFGDDLKYERDRMKAILANVSKEVAQNFYDPDLRGLDWKKLTDEAAVRIERAPSRRQMVTAIFALVDSLQNSHTIFMPPGFVDKPFFGFEAKAYGGEIRVSQLADGSPAAIAGLMLGDRILSINRLSVDRSNIDLTMLVLRALRPVMAMEIQVASGSGAARTVRIDAQIRKGMRTLDLTQIENLYQLIREAENQAPRFSYQAYDDGIGYLGLPTFAVDGDFLDGLVKEVKKSRAMLVDVRNNPGGSLETLASFAGCFVDKSDTIGYMLGRKRSEPLKLKPRNPTLAGPLFILVDSQSASSAELFARHFQRTGRATVIGDRTSGRASVSRFLPGMIGMDRVVFYGVQVATARMVLPGGEELEGRGVTPDRSCVPLPEDLRERRDPCFALAYQEARKALGLERP